MDRRWTLAALWALFAAAAVGVGFGAAGLVGDPFSEPGQAGQGGQGGQGVALPTVSIAGSTPPASPAHTSGPPTRHSRTPSPTHSTSHSTSPTASTSHSSRPTASPDRTPDAEVRSVTTSGGYVAGSCRRNLVTVSASPAVGWRIDEIDSRPTEEATVKFRQSSGDGEVEVHARCVDGRARFEVGGGGGSGGFSGASAGDR